MAAFAAGFVELTAGTSVGGITYIRPLSESCADRAARIRGADEGVNVASVGATFGSADKAGKTRREGSKAFFEDGPR